MQPKDFHPSQVTPHRPDEGLWGNCMQCALAAILGIRVDQVPDFGQMAPDDEDQGEIDAMWRAVDKWLTKHHGYVLTHFAFTATVRDTLDYMAHHNPDIAYLAGVQSKRAKHFIVCRNDQMIFDSSFGTIDDYSQCDGEHVWVDVLVPAAMLPRA